MGVLTMGCSNKKLIAQKDQNIASLQEEVESLENQLATQRQMNEDLEQMLSEYKKKEQVWMEEKEGMMQITLDGSATFATASAELSTEGKRIIDSIWQVLERYPDRMILIEGHADSRPIAPSYQYKFKSNWELSSARAHSVLHYVREKYGTDPSKIMAVGCGEHQPIADNMTEKGMATNRRVVITVAPKASRTKKVKGPEA
ncbi:MAG: OmpA family protein [Candidatus Latescibacteria bacterium]|nr:OmpA family protein [Candidatus Latescibacterota bacterium]